jgi:ArsR family transcriptional regulator
MSLLSQEKYGCVLLLCPMSNNQNKIKKAANWLKSISHPTRLEIMVLLKGRKGLTVGEICKRINVEQSLVSHHLASMRRKGVLEAKRNGIHISYSISDPKAIEVMQKAFESQMVKR